MDVYDCHSEETASACKDAQSKYTEIVTAASSVRKHTHSYGVEKISPFRKSLPASGKRGAIRRFYVLIHA
jgi:hypothetical protein